MTKTYDMHASSFSISNTCIERVWRSRARRAVFYILAALAISVGECAEEFTPQGMLYGRPDATSSMVTVIGLVRHYGVYFLQPSDQGISHVLDIAQPIDRQDKSGTRYFPDLRRVRIIRRGEDQKFVLIRVDVKLIRSGDRRDVKLKDGDVVSIEPLAGF